MKYKALLMSAALLPCFSSLSEANIITTRTTAGAFKSGVYLGAHGGYTHEVHEHRGKIGGLTERTHKADRKNHRFVPELSIGYRHFINCMLLGLEISGNVDKTKSSYTSKDPFGHEAKTTLKSKWHLMPAVVVGGALNNFVVLYAKVGMDYGKYGYRLHTSPTVADAASVSKSKNINRFMLAGGVEYAINSTFGVRAEIGHSFKKGFHYKRQDGDHTYKMKHAPSTTMVKVGFLFKV
jgi:opacity protein-like surface antigen